jgi:hypothetical protein
MTATKKSKKKQKRLVKRDWCKIELQEFESINPSLFIWIGNLNHDLTNILDIWSGINRLGSSCLLR